MNSFVPLAGTVFSSKGVKLKRKVALGFPLVVSVLTYNVHVWSTFAGAARRHLNHVYMRLWRRICDDPRYGRTRLTDLQVCRHVGAQSIDCYVRKRRLKYMSRLARADIAPLDGLLQARGKNGECLPWVNLVRSDLRILHRALPHTCKALIRIPLCTGSLRNRIPLNGRASLISILTFRTMCRGIRVRARDGAPPAACRSSVKSAMWPSALQGSWGFTIGSNMGCGALFFDTLGIGALVRIA